MEGVPRISMLSFPMRKSANAPQFKNKLKGYIRDEYKEDGDSYTTEMHELESLRAGAVHVTKDFTGCATLKKYFCQLNFLRTRFPIVQGGPCEILFSWLDAFSEAECSRYDLEFEMSSVLYNIGALHTELGATDNRQTPDGMKNACTHFQCAAWAFQHFRHNYQAWFTPDVGPDPLSIMINICLAQAQECILEKSLVDNRKSTITAKVALQIVEYYQLALKTCDQMLKDAGVYPDKLIKSIKKWKKLLELKSHYYDCISLLYRGMQAEDENKYGDRVAFYKAALEKLTEAAKSAKSLDKTDNVHDTIQFTFDVVQGKVQISERENEFIYHEKVPELSAVSSEIKGVSLVKGIPFKFDDPQISGTDIFGRLVPIQAHEVSSLYSEEKAKILRHYAGKIEAKNEALDKMIIALQLDQIDFHSAIKKIPQELVDCCAALSVNKDAVKNMSDAMAKLSGMYHDVEGNLNESEDFLKEDEAKEKEHQQIMGTKRPPSNVVVELSKELQKYRSAQSVAAETNQTLHDAISKHVGNLQILMKPFDEVMKHVPAFEEDDQADQEAIAQMKRLIGKVDEMRKQRAMLENQLRESIHNDDITNKIVTKSDTDLKELFSEELKKHDKVTQILDQNLLAQDNIIRALTEANANYAETRKKTVQAMKRRDKVIEELLSSYESYDELLNKCNKGIEFYTKLDTNVQKLLQRVRAVCKVQEEERESGMKNLINKTKNMNLGMTMGMGSGPSAPMTMGLGYVPPQSGPAGFSNVPVAPSGGGHLKLKDYLKLNQQNKSVLAATPSSYSQTPQGSNQPVQPVIPSSYAQGQGVMNKVQLPNAQPIPSSIPQSSQGPVNGQAASSHPFPQTPQGSINAYQMHQPMPSSYPQQHPGLTHNNQPQLPPPQSMLSSFPQSSQVFNNYQPPQVQPTPNTSTYQPSQGMMNNFPPQSQQTHSYVPSSNGVTNNYQVPKSQPPISYPQSSQGLPNNYLPQQAQSTPSPYMQNTQGVMHNYQQPQSQVPPPQTPTPPLPQQTFQQYNPTEGFLARYVKQHSDDGESLMNKHSGMGYIPSSSSAGPVSYPNSTVPPGGVYNPQSHASVPTSTYPQNPQGSVNNYQLPQGQPTATATPPPAPQQAFQEYNPNESFLAKYVKQHQGSTTLPNKGATPTSYLISQSPQFRQQSPYQHQQQQQQYLPAGGQGQTQYPNPNGQQPNGNSYQQQNYYGQQQQNYPNQDTGTTYSNMQPAPVPPAEPQVPGPVQRNSNIDLLSDLDFNVSQQPLTPAAAQPNQDA